MTNYDQYNALTPGARKSLPATNFWLIAAEREPISVPKTDKEYYRYFTDVQHQNALAILEKRKSGFLPMVTISLDTPRSKCEDVVFEKEAIVAPREKLQPPPAKQKKVVERPQSSLF